MSWTEAKVQKLKDLWGKGKTASEIASIIGGISRNAVIGKAHRLNLSAKIKARNKTPNNQQFNDQEESFKKRGRRNRLRTLLIEKNFEPAKNLKLEELTENTCKYMGHDQHPDQADSTFCGRKTVEKFSYCALHLMVVFQPKGKKDEIVDKNEEVPQFIESKIKSA